MLNLTRFAICTMSLLIASMTVVPTVQAAPDEDLWDFLGSGVTSAEGLLIMVTPRIEKPTQTKHKDEDLWDLVGPEVVAFVIDGDRIYLNSGTDRDPHWEPISEKEFWQLVELLEDAGFDLVAQQEPEEVIVLVLLF